jgi:dimethylargininase
MRRQYGSQSMIEPLHKVMVKRPDASFAVDDPASWHYAGRPDISAAQQEHDFLVSLLRTAGSEIIYLDTPQPDRADSIFVFDPALSTSSS